MASILDYKFYLNFKNDDSFGRIEITEPVGFDGSNFVVEQEEARFGRDSYKFNEEISLSFYKGAFDATDVQSQLPNGTVIYNLTQGYEYIIEVYKKWGFEANVDFEIELDGLIFIPSNLDFQNSETDGYSYFTCSAVQEQGKQLIKRRSDIVTDLFSTEDLDGNEVTPIQTHNLLLKAKPIRAISTWGADNIEADTLSYNFTTQFFNGLRNQTSSDIEDSLVPFNSISGSVDNNFKYIDSKTDLSSVKLTISDLSFYVDVIEPEFFDPIPIRLGYVIKDTNDNDITVEEMTTLFDYGETPINITGQNLEFDLPNVASGKALYVCFYNRTFADRPGVNRPYEILFSEGDMSITATSTAIDTVIKAVRYIDVFKENVKRINGFDVYSPKYDVGGIYYNQFAFTGNLIKQRTEDAFSVDFETITNDLLELCGGRQTLSDKIYINNYKDFYPNKEIGVFLSSPDESFKSTFNPRYAINEFSYKYNNYEQDRDEEDTTDAIHTDTQWLPSNKQVENTKEVSIELIRDAFKIESSRKLAAQETTSTDDDDKLFVVDAVSLSPSASGGFSASMNHNINTDDRLQLLKDSDLPSWSLLGFGVGSLFYVDSEDNNGTYTVYEIEDSIITLTPNGFVPDFEGAVFTEVSYPYSNVLYTNRTNEGLIYSENLLNADNYSNLRYSIKRNMEAWKPYLATASKYSPEGTLKNTYFKDNGACITRFEGESENIQEDADILNEDLGDGILTPILYETTLLAPYNDMIALINAVDTINDDDTIGGFIRCVDNNGRVIKLYPQKLDYMPSTEVLILTGEERNDGEGVDIVTDNGIVYVNEVGYSEISLTEPFYEFDGDYFKIYDSNNLPIINPTKYDEITVNGSSFDSSSDLLEYLING